MTGAWNLVRLILRRDRILLPIWVLLLGALPGTYATSFFELLPDDAARATFAATTASNPSVEAMLGPIYGSSIGAFTAQRVGFLYAIVGLVNLLTVIRHTRTEEDAGRRELVAATAISRHAPLTAVLAVTFAANLLLGLIAAAGLSKTGLPSSGSLLIGLTLAGTGWVFAAIGALVAQLTEGAGAARGLGIAVLGAAFLVKAAGDGAASSVSWASPLAWGQHSRPYEGDQWWVAALFVIVAAVIAVPAYRMAASRDVGAGMVPARLGPAEAAPRLSTPLALAWRLHRGLLAGWTAGFALAGLLFGGAAKAASDVLSSNKEMADLLAKLSGGSSVTDLYLAEIMGVSAIVAAAYGIQAALRMRAEETGLRMEPVLATSVGRIKWAAAHLVFAVLGPAVALAATGLASGLTYGLAVHDLSGQLPRVLGAAVVQLPAVLVLTGITVALFGLAPKLTSAAWGALAVCLFLGQLGALLQLSQGALDISPFTHVPKLPGGTVTATPLITLTAVAAAFLVVGLYAFRRRDVTTG
ncbi:ABC transporter permease [Streptosporangiaceae bacterium NEAU-GS5]|nr:ABC transporter permease [Streptosporangiaceae bacterium NEAU-GS5]